MCVCYRCLSAETFQSKGTEDSKLVLKTITMQGKDSGSSYTLKGKSDYRPDMHFWLIQTHHEEKTLKEPGHTYLYISILKIWMPTTVGIKKNEKAQPANSSSAGNP